MSDDGIQPMRSILAGCVEFAEKLFKCYDLFIIKTQPGNRELCEIEAFPTLFAKIYTMTEN